VDINSAVGRKAGLTDEQLAAVLGDDLSRLNDVERLVVELADAMVTTPSNISDGLFSRLRQQFSEEQLLELSAQIAFENFRARLNRVFDVGSDEIYRPQAA
jgi:alkylhydroperoxidase family enzyme